MNCKCGNAGRYINERGELCCAICPLGENIDSIRLADVPALLAWTRKFVNLHAEHPWQQSLREIIGRGPAPKVFAAQAPLVITNVEQLLNDQTYLSYVPTSADGAIIGAPLAHRLAEAEQRPCATCGKPGHQPMDHAGWDPTQEGHG